MQPSRRDCNNIEECVVRLKLVTQRITEALLTKALIKSPKTLNRLSEYRIGLLSLVLQ